jgi:hypothetical protein
MTLQRVATWLRAIGTAAACASLGCFPGDPLCNEFFTPECATELEEVVVTGSNECGGDACYSGEDFCQIYDCSGGGDSGLPGGPGGGGDGGGGEAGDPNSCLGQAQAFCTDGYWICIEAADAEFRSCLESYPEGNPGLPCYETYQETTGDGGECDGEYSICVAGSGC